MSTAICSLGIEFHCFSGMLFIVLPSGRRLAYVKPRIGENQFGGESVTYEGVGGTKKWERLESYGPKFVENIVQAISREILMYSMKMISTYRIVAHVHDEGISGTKMEKRTELLRMIRDCKQGRIDFIITKSISRFARNTVDCLELVRKLIDIGVYFYFEKENLNTGDMESELMLSILSGFAAEESASISQNSTWSIQKRFQNGSYVGTPPYGYTNIDGEMVIVPEEAEIIKRIFAECLSGKGGGTIARGLNKDKIPARRGNHWSSGTVIEML